jgi:hypothetical protein
MTNLTKLNFQPHPAGYGERAVLDLPNGWAVSVLKGGYFYTSDGTFELGVMHNGELHYHNKVAEGDVRGYLGAVELDELIGEVEAYDPDVNVVEADYRNSQND